MRQYSNFQTEVCTGVIKLILLGVGLVISLGLKLVLLVFKAFLTLGHSVLK